MNKFLAIFMLASSGVAMADVPVRHMLIIVDDYQQAYHECFYGSPDRSEQDTKPFCDKVEALTKKLNKQGLCTYGHAGVGEFSKDKKHCYAREWFWN